MKKIESITLYNDNDSEQCYLDIRCDKKSSGFCAQYFSSDRYKGNLALIELNMKFEASGYASEARLFRDVKNLQVLYGDDSNFKARSSIQ